MRCQLHACTRTYRNARRCPSWFDSLSPHLETIHRLCGHQGPRTVGRRPARIPPNQSKSCKIPSRSYSDHTQMILRSCWDPLKGLNWRRNLLISMSDTLSAPPWLPDPGTSRPLRVAALPHRMGVRATPNSKCLHTAGEKHWKTLKNHQPTRNTRRFLLINPTIQPTIFWVRAKDSESIPNKSLNGSVSKPCTPGEHQNSW